jgi:hypothetical protein
VNSRSSDPTLMEFIRILAAGESDRALEMLEQAPSLAIAVMHEGATRETAKPYYLGEIGHYGYRGDTALHIAAAGYRTDAARALVSCGADPSAQNRRGARPLHYAADGNPDAVSWDPDAQAATVAFLIEAGADPDAADRGGVTPLHRAVRTRCTSAVRALLDGGANPSPVNKGGSTPLKLATQFTGRGGSGSVAAKAQQAQIIQLFEQYDVTR